MAFFAWVKALGGVLVRLIGCKQRLFEGLEAKACGQVREAVDAFLGGIVGKEALFGSVEALGGLFVLAELGALDLGDEFFESVVELLYEFLKRFQEVGIEGLEGILKLCDGVLEGGGELFAEVVLIERVVGLLLRDAGHEGGFGGLEIVGGQAKVVEEFLLAGFDPYEASARKDHRHGEIHESVKRGHLCKVSDLAGPTDISSGREQLILEDRAQQSGSAEAAGRSLKVFEEFLA